MAGQITQIKKKIGSTKNTRKITKAMQLVASSKMKQFQIKAVSARDYAWDLLKVMGSIIDENTVNAFTETRGIGKTVFVLYTSDKGLCGSLNSKLIRALFQSGEWKNTPENNRILITIGKKSYDYAKYNNISMEKNFSYLNDNLTTLESLEVIDGILEYWIDGTARKILMTAPHYKSAIAFYPVLKTYLPFSTEMVQQNLRQAEAVSSSKDTASSHNILADEPPTIFEPDQEQVLEAMTEQVIYSLFLQSFLELKASEYSSRMMAMQSATDAASDMIDSLTLRYNKARQAAITQEIAEITGGAEAF